MKCEDERLNLTPNAARRGDLKLRSQIKCLVGASQYRIPLLYRLIIGLELQHAPSHLDQQHPEARVTDFRDGTQALLGGLPRGMLTGTQAPKTTDLVRIFKSIVVVDLPLHLHQRQSSGALGPWTLETAHQFAFKLRNLLIQQQQMGLAEHQRGHYPLRNRPSQF